MTAEVDNLLVGDGIDRARGKGETGVHLAHVLDEIDAGGVDRVKGRELSAVEYGQNKGVVVNRKLSGHPVIKGVGRHIRVGLALQNAVYVVGHILAAPARPSNVPRLDFGRVSRPGVHRGADGRNIPGPPGERRKARVERGEEPKRREV